MSYATLWCQFMIANAISTNIFQYYKMMQSMYTCLINDITMSHGFAIVASFIHV
ncbi:hypothetical protein ACJX0J_037386, partial [Zea mays]